MITVLCGDMREELARLEADSLDACVTDPPYELGFMNRAWDRSGIAFDPATWAAVLRVLKPGAHIVAFGGTRTWHRIACAIEDAGFEIRDSLAWLFGSGFPKSMNVGREVLKRLRETDGADPVFVARVERGEIGTALKPFFEPVILARKPAGMPIVECVMRHGTGALNIGGCRIAFASSEDETEAKAKNDHERFESGPRTNSVRRSSVTYNADTRPRETWNPGGRWPPNVIVDGEAAWLLDEASGHLPEGFARKSNTEVGKRTGHVYGGIKNTGKDSGYPDGGGGASRFVYVAKADESERDAGLDELPIFAAAELVEREEGSAGINNPRAGAGRTSEGRRNMHPTVKPIDTMRWLIRLVTPLGGRILDPFFGSGTTGVAAAIEGVDALGIELDTAHALIAWHRCERFAGMALAPGTTAKVAARAVRARDETAHLDLFDTRSKP